MEGGNEIHARFKVGPAYGDSDWFYDNFWGENVTVWERCGMWDLRKEGTFDFHHQTFTDHLAGLERQEVAVREQVVLA